MNYKEFANRSEEILGKMDLEELKRCINGIIRKVPEKKRAIFIQLLENSYNNEISEEDNKKNQLKRIMSDIEVGEKLTQIKETFSKIEEGDLCLYAEGYEDYSNGYWTSDWIWEYEDRAGVGKIIEDAVIFAHDCVNDCRYEEALSVYNQIMELSVYVDDENGGDSFYLRFEEIKDEKLIGINLNVMSLDVLYSVYQSKAENERVNDMYSYFSYPYFKDIHIEDIFFVGREALKNTDKFWELWIDLLMRQSGELAARLLREGILYHKGAVGLLEMARKGFNEHPSIYLSTLLEFEKNRDYEKMREIGNEALDNVGSNLKIRGDIALKTAQAAWSVNDNDFMKKCWYEAFHSNSTIPNYLRLFTENDSVNEYKTIAEKRIEKLKIVDNYYNRETSETTENTVSTFEYKCLSFYTGKFEMVQNWCMEQKEPLGWSGKFISYGLDLMILLLYVDQNLQKAVKSIVARVSRRFGFDEAKNLLFIKENYIFETEVSALKYDEVFWNIFCLWKTNYEISANDKNRYIDCLESIVDKRISAIVNGKYRRKYNDIALLAAAIGEVKESIGYSMAKSNIIKKYMGKYPRHTSFRSELKDYLN